MELKRLFEIVEFKKTGGNDIQSPSIEEAQELALMALVSAGRVEVLTYKPADPKCTECNGEGVIDDNGTVSICPCSIRDEPLVAPELTEETPAIPDQEPTQ